MINSVSGPTSDTSTTFKFIDLSNEPLESYEARWNEAIMRLQAQGLTIAQDDPTYTVDLTPVAGTLGVWNTVPL